MTTYEKLNERLQPIYKQFLDDKGISSGDIEPMLAKQFEQVERDLANLINKWIED